MSFKKIPLILKILGLLPIIAVIIKIYTSIDNESENAKRFYNQSFSAIVSSNSYEGRSIEFHLNNGLKVYFWPSSSLDEKIAIGDSIKKEDSTYLYFVYRKENDNKYKYLSSYDFKKIE
ncbi:hypothetical protein F0919_03875 [Taibaiella lutea]|uniref:Uncharacterized protein n=1 Tax=Taibaiella lutea TaxID=2608001 RepID=A0A5M6CNM2_9BACT|nr:hypothetical protein [Taibaiella lutea]KAA5536818.1 hypothetical protein F0919_03875 [Taibaiella lutea]